MASEILTVPEDYLAEVIKIIRDGLAANPQCDPDVMENLTRWCDEEEDYLEDDDDDE